MTNDDIKNFIVRLNGGTGVIFQPLDIAHSYILTAKHVLYDNEVLQTNAVIDRYNPLTQGYDNHQVPLVLDENLFFHPDLKRDVAIIKMNRLAGAEELVRIDDPNKDGFTFSLFGYPWTRRGEVNEADKLRQDLNLTISIEKANGKREAVLADHSTWDELVGQSGGGLFCVQGDTVFLLGIQNQVPNKIEHQGRIEFSQLFNFDELVRTTNGKLEELIPGFIKSFLFLKSNAFNLPKHHLTKTLVENIEALIGPWGAKICSASITPACIIEVLGNDRMLVAGQKNENLYLISLWILWYEFLTIVSIAKGRPLELNEMKELLNEIRAFHSPEENDFWIDHLETIARTNFKDLAKDGLVVVSSLQAPHNDSFILEKDTIPNIADIRFKFDSAIGAPFGPEQTNVGRAPVFPYDEYRFVHIEYFKQKSIINEYRDYQGLTHADVLAKLKDKYGKLIS